MNTSRKSISSDLNIAPPRRPELRPLRPPHQNPYSEWGGGQRSARGRGGGAGAGRWGTAPRAESPPTPEPRQGRPDPADLRRALVGRRVDTPHTLPYIPRARRRPVGATSKDPPRFGPKFTPQ